jgi:G:T/U-mismatch repair DNA glycosylase
MDDVETHPYNTSEPIPKGTRLLIVGTSPPLRFSNGNSERSKGDINFYYGSRDNQLWSEIMPKVYEQAPSLDTRGAIVEFLKAHKIWMVDVLEKYRRNKPNASDHELRPDVFTKFAPIFRQNHEVDTVIFTGRTAEAWTFDCLIEDGLISTNALSRNQTDMPKYVQLELKLEDDNFNKVDFYTLPSPSNANNQVYSLKRKIELYRAILHSSVS